MVIGRVEVFGLFLGSNFDLEYVWTIDMLKILGFE